MKADQQSFTSSMDGAEHGIEIVGIDKTFHTTGGGHVVALENINFEIRPGSFVSLIGPSGCGKSTLLKTIGGLITPDRGHILVGGGQRSKVLEDAAFVFQNPVLLPWRTVLSNVLYPLELHGRANAAGKEEARRCLELVGLAEFADSYPYELSGGMQQRAGIARALVQKPKILLMDEPFGALDAMTREALNVEISRLCTLTGVTALFVTHSIPEAALLSDRVVVMGSRPGRVKEVVDIPWERPRTLEVTGKPEFGAVTDVLRKHLNASGVDL